MVARTVTMLNRNSFLTIWVGPPIIYIFRRLCIYIFKIVYNLAPSYLKCNVSFRSSCHNHNTRGGSLSIFLQRVNSTGLNSFSYTATKHWNSIPHHIRACNSVGSFKSRLKAHLFNRLLANFNDDFLSL